MSELGYITTRRAENRRLGLAYLAKLRKGEHAPYADIKIARRLRKGSCGDDLRLEFSKLVTKRRYVKQRQRTHRAKEHLDRVEIGSTIYADNGAVQSIENGYVDNIFAERLTKAREKRAKAREKLIEQFLDYFKLHGTTKLGSRPHPGYLRLRSESQESPFRSRYGALCQMHAEVDRIAMLNMIAHYEKTGHISDRRIRDRIIRYQNCYGDLYARYQAAQIRFRGHRALLAMRKS
jgi:hypothetical protein